MPAPALGLPFFRFTVGCEKAAASLEGGLTSLYEGLTDSRRPCTEVLSVPGFFAVLGAFPGRKEVYSEGEMAPFLAGRPLSLNPVTKSVNPGYRPEYRTCVQRVCTGQCTREATYQCTPGRHIYRVG